MILALAGVAFLVAKPRRLVLGFLVDGRNAFVVLLFEQQQLRFASLPRIRRRLTATAA